MPNHHKLLQNLVVFIFIQLFLIFGMSLSLWRYNQGQLFYYDFGIFAHIIYQLSQFKLPYLDHIELGHVMFLGDHFNPSLSFLAPLFWVIKDIRILVTQQALPLSLSALIIYKICKKLNLNFFFTLTALVLFLGFPGNLNPLLTDWHPETTANFFLLLFIYLFVFKEKTLSSIIPFLIFLGFKESNAITITATLIWATLYKPKLIKKTFKLSLFTLSYFLLTTKAIIPLINKQKYIYTPQLPTTLPQLIYNLSTHQKINFLLQSLKFFLFLPLIGGISLLPAISEFAIRFVPTHSKFESFTLGMHYNVYLGSFLTLASIFGLLKLQKYLTNQLKTKLQTIAFITISIVILFSLAFTHKKAQGLSPLNLLINPAFWTSLNNDQWIKDRFSNIPSVSSIMSQNNILPYLVTKSPTLYLFQGNYKSKNPDLIIFDTSPNQNINNFYGSNLDKINLTIQQLHQDSTFTKLPSFHPNYHIFIKTNLYQLPTQAKP